MPFTPFHFGPGLLLKSAAPRRLSVVAFALANVAIDVETLYHLTRQEFPLHRWAHTVPFATLIGIATGAAYGAIARRFSLSTGNSGLAAESRLMPAIVGGFLGGVTHPLLDGLVHGDVRPFWPLSDANPLFGLISNTAVVTLCLFAGIAGFFVLAVRLARQNQRQ